MLTIFANIRISDRESLTHLKDSLFSFRSISDNWIINVRGSFRGEALVFLKQELGADGIFFELLDDSRGWAINSLEMIEKAKYEYILFWNEDHLNIAPQALFADIINDMKAAKADYLQYSWWFGGKIRGGFEQIKLENYKSIDAVYLTDEKWKEVRSLGYRYFIIALQGIYQKDFFKRLLEKDNNRVSFFDARSIVNFAKKTLAFLGITSGREKWFNRINKYIFRKKLRRFSKEAPFDLEYEPDRTDILPIKIALPKQELFACIDDDNGEQEYQLIKRGLYPVSGFITTVSEPIKGEAEKLILNKDQHYAHKYYEDTVRTQELLRESLRLEKGSVKILSGKEMRTLSSGEIIEVYPNIGYEISALETSELIRISPVVASRKNVG